MDDALVHYGVKGMRWGVRKKFRATKTSPAASGKMKARAPSEAQLEAAIRKAEKQVRYARLNKELSSINRSEGRKTVERLVTTAATVAVTTAASTVTSKVVKKYLKNL